MTTSENTTTRTSHSVQVRVSGQWHDTSRSWTDAQSAASFAGYLNVLGLPARPCVHAVDEWAPTGYTRHATSGFSCAGDEAISDAVLAH
jgi:hypothetical protein